jgi:flavin-dependent dehydrogenase
MATKMNDRINRIVIVGGGSAGWLTAGLIASEHIARSGRDVSVTLIESPDVKTIGVGEGTWPTMRSTLQKIGLSETEFLTECSASFKQGTKFVGWVTGDDDDSYYHPFTVPAGYASLNLVPFWQAQKDKTSFVDAVSVQGRVCDRDLAPKQVTTPEYAAVVNYAYHLDAGKFAELLHRHCTTRLGVTHILDHVTGINGEPGGDIESLATANNGELEGDLFIDCTGMASMLLGKHFGVGLTTRRGIGYTYSSRHTTDDEAEKELRAYVERLKGMSVESLEPRKIAFRPGHRERFWHRNCVAVGMAAGFLEPLEASALVLVELAGKMISEELPASRSVMDIVAKRYNEVFLYRWDRIIDFLKLHYVLSMRSDTQYWIDNRKPETIPESLQELLRLWRYQPPWHNDFSQREEIFSSASYQYVLYGMGFETAARDSAPDSRSAGEAQRLFAENNQMTSKVVANLPANRELLATISQSGSAARQ